MRYCNYVKNYLSPKITTLLMSKNNGLTNFFSSAKILRSIRANNILKVQQMIITLDSLKKQHLKMQPVYLLQA